MKKACTQKTMTLMKETEATQIIEKYTALMDWKIMVKMFLLFKEINRLKQFPSNPKGLFTKPEQITIKFVWKHKKILKGQSNIEKEEQRWRHLPPLLQTTLQSYGNQNSMIVAQKKTENNGIELSPERNVHFHDQLIYKKGSKTMKLGKDNLFNKWCLVNWTVICEWLTLHYFFT